MEDRLQRVKDVVPQSRQFLTEVWSELRKVHWPTPVQARNLTALVIGVSVGTGLILGGLDYVLASIFKFVIGVR